MPEKKDYITEDDKVYDIVKKYPGIKEKLEEISPKFKNLNNPVLFNTVAKVTTFKKAAVIGGVYLRELLYQLNEVIGKSREYLADAKKEITQQKDDFLQKSFESKEAATIPEWVSRSSGFEVLDVRGMTEDPFQKIFSKAQTLKTGEGFCLVQKFMPLPLISYLESQGFEHYGKKEADNQFVVLFYKVR